MFRPLVRQVSCLLAVFLVTTSAGCARRHTAARPVELFRPDQVVDLNASSSAPQAVDAHLLSVLAGGPPDQGVEGVSQGPTKNFLALSGGGAYGAFTVGVLNGWTATGTRPNFDVVTGVSTGALIATYAFLGPAYDPQIRSLYTQSTSDDIFVRRPKIAVLWSESLADSAPLAELIDTQVDQRILAAVAMAHAEGRRLYVGTTNLETSRLVIWDMGAIASSGRPEALALYRKIVLASASVPGFLPPVPIDVTVNGRQYVEQHIDGATTSQVFLRASMLSLDPAKVARSGRPMRGSNVYIIVAGKPYADPQSVDPRIMSIGTSALSSLTYAQARGDLVRIYTLALLTGMSFHMAAIPQDLPMSHDSMEFEPAELRRLYAVGYQLATSGGAWRNTPPVVEPSEQSIPRAGTQFLTAEENLPENRPGQ